MYMKNPSLPPNKSIYIAVGIFMVSAAILFSLANGFRTSIGHIGLAGVGCVAIILGLFIRETSLVVFSRWLILVNILAGIAWFFLNNSHY